MLKIETPFFSAGKQYGWGEEYNSVGLGIRMNLVMGEGILYLTVGDSEKVYRIDKAKGREIVKKYNSYHDAKGTRLAVIPWDAFETEKQEELLLPEQPEVQMSLF